MPSPTPLALVRGSLDVLVLKALSWTPMHGFEITCWLEERSAGSLDVQDSALYQALQRLEDRGHVRTRWGMTENNRRARWLFSVTPHSAAASPRASRRWSAW